MDYTTGEKAGFWVLTAVGLLALPLLLVLFGLARGVWLCTGAVQYCSAIIKGWNAGSA